MKQAVLKYKPDLCTEVTEAYQSASQNWLQISALDSGNLNHSSSVYNGVFYKSLNPDSEQVSAEMLNYTCCSETFRNT